MGIRNRPHLHGRCLAAGMVVLPALSGYLCAGFVLPGWDVSESAISHAGAVSFNKGPGSMEVSDLTFSSLLSPPLTCGGSFTISPIADFRASVLRFEKIPTSAIDETLQSVSVYPVTIDLGALFVMKSDDSPWIHGIWASEQLASDLRDVDPEDFGFKIAGFSGYRFSDELTFGVGVGIERSDDNTTILPGIGIDWRIHEQLQLAVCGAQWSLTFRPDQVWEYSLRGDNTDEIWNLLDKGGETLSLSFESYRIGLFASRHLTDQAWIDAGIGTTFGNEVHLRDSYGKSVVKEGLHVGLFGQISLTIRSW